MPTRKRLQRDGTPPLEMVTSDPVLVGPGRHSGKHRMVVYEAVDYLGTRFRLGNHVTMYAPAGGEWVCVLEVLYYDDKQKQAMFKGRWFWSVNDFALIENNLLEPMRESKCDSHELIACDNRDTNLVESISRKCHILSYDNFLLVKKTITRPEFSSEKVFFCEREFYHKAFRFSEMNPLLFPGDSIPRSLRKAAGLPELHEAAPSLAEESIDLEQVYYESEVTKGKRKAGKGDKSPNMSSDPVLLW